MESDAKSASRSPTGGRTLPKPRNVSSSHRWVDLLRNESGYVAVTVGLDIWSASWAVVLAQWWIAGPVHERNIALYSWLFVPMLIGMLATRSLYRRRLGHSFIDDFEPVVTSVAVATVTTLIILLLLVPPLQPGETVVPYVRPSSMMVRIAVCAALLVPAVRLVRSLAQRYLRRRHRFGASALVIGSGPICHQLIQRMHQVPDYGLHPAGLLDDVRPAELSPLRVPYLGATDELESAVLATGAKELVIGPSSVSDEQLARTALLAQRLGMRVRVVPRVMDAVGSKARVEHLGGIPLMHLGHIDPKGWQFALKHAFDRTAAGVGLVILSPLFLALTLLVVMSSPGPIFFRQQRVGRDGKVFDCLKFRTMRPLVSATSGFELQAGAAPGGVEGDDRRTWVGRIMRKASLDELPQLVNVLRGEMSLVGPRPERPEFVDLFAMQVRRYGDRHRVKAGITGWAQVHGLRGQTSIADRAEFDNHYIQNWSLSLDFKILLLTVLAVLRTAED